MARRVGRRLWVSALGVAVVAAVAAVAVVVVLGGSDDAAAAVRLEAVGSSFDGDFAGDLDLLGAGAGIAGALPDVPPLGASLAGALAGLRRMGGDEPGLYGGSRSVGTCDVDQLLRFLTDRANAAKARAWADALGIDEADIASFVRELTPVRLRFDTAVTNHGFVDGRANPIAAVLEAGTAVLVDDGGVPRVKCNCGNPLAPPGFGADALARAGADREGGRAWPAFDTDRVAAVSAGGPVRRFVVVDSDDGALFARPVGTNGEADAPVPASAALCGVFASSPTCTGAGVARDVAMPDVAGSTLGAARAALETAGFVRAAAVAEEPSADVPAGLVLRSEPPAGRVVPVKSPVTLVVSAGPPPGATSSTTTTAATTSTSAPGVAVPDVAGLGQRSAQAVLAEAGLGSVVTRVPSEDVPAGIAVGTVPEAGSTVAEGSTVELLVSSGPDVVAVPDVVGMTEAAARATLADAGLQAVTRGDQGAPSEATGTVTSQDPPAGTVVARGSTVTILVATPPG